MDSGIELSEPMRVELLLDLSGLPRQEAMLIKACTNDSRNFECVRATLVEYHTGVHLSEGRTSGGSYQDHRRSGKGPRQGFSGKAYSRGKGKRFVSKAYIADDEALAYPDEATTTTTTRTPTRRPRALLSGLGNEGWLRIRRVFLRCCREGGRRRRELLQSYEVFELEEDEALALNALEELDPDAIQLQLAYVPSGNETEPHANMVSDLSAGFKAGPAAPSSSMQMEGGDRSLTLGQHKGSTYEDVSRKLEYVTCTAQIRDFLTWFIGCYIINLGLEGRPYRETRASVAIPEETYNPRTKAKGPKKVPPNPPVNRCATCADFM